jgi:tRNA U34 5-carboxymethylaminomethyl modifying enzyme MnmG/GidA
MEYACVSFMYQSDGLKLNQIAIQFLANGKEIESKSVVITTGTFLKGEIHIGLESYPAGRFNEEASIGLSNSLTAAGLKLKRLRTGERS